MKGVITVLLLSIGTPILAQQPDREDIESIRRFRRASSDIKQEAPTTMKIKLKTLSEGKVELTIGHSEGIEAKEDKIVDPIPKKKLRRRCDEQDFD